jgi:hypothetical protein
MRRARSTASARPARLRGRSSILLNSEIDAALADGAVKKRVAELGTIPLAGNADEFGTMLAAETEHCGRSSSCRARRKADQWPIFAVFDCGVRLIPARRPRACSANRLGRATRCFRSRGGTEHAKRGNCFGLQRRRATALKKTNIAGR